MMDPPNKLPYQATAQVSGDELFEQKITTLWPDKFLYAVTVQQSSNRQTR